jgi:myo-inositol 2-dehydrogenase / D-chiro-inositol 1-dehydrogenase
MGAGAAAPFRLGLIGAGRMGRTHLRGLAGSERVAVTAIAEVSEATRRTVPDVGAPVYPGIAEMLDAEALDGVLIVVPTDRHLQVITEVAARGLPILCEKPCGLTVAQTQAAVAETQAAGVPFQVAYWRRYVPSLRALRDQIASGELGTVHLVACYQWDDRPPSDEFRAHSGGILIDMGVHEFDEMRWLTGQDLGSMAAIASGLVPGGLIRRVSGEDRRSADVDGAQVLVELSGGGSGLVSLGRFHPAGDMARAEAFGTKGTVRCDFLDPAEGEQAQLAALRLQAESFADFASGGPCTGATGADAVAALDAATRAGAAIPALGA